MHGQAGDGGDGDGVAVKEVQLGGGQRATIIMEDGRIKRIVSGNGQVAELRWQHAQPSPQENHSRLPMTVSLSQYATASAALGPVPPIVSACTVSSIISFAVFLLF